MKRIATRYPGVFYREAERIGGTGTERVYYIVFKKDGKVIEEKVGRQYADDMTEARANRIRGERIEGKRQSRKEVREQEKKRQQEEQNRWTIGRLWGEYKLQKSLRGLAQDESRYRTHLEPSFADKEPAGLVALDVDRLRIKLLKTKKPQTVKNTLALLRRIIRFGVNKGLCKGPEFTIQMPTKINNIRTEDLTNEQLARLLAVLDEESDLQVANMVRLVLTTGMRRGELFRLRWDDVDFSKSFIHLRNPKGGKDVVIPMNRSARKVLENHPRLDGSPYVFPGRHGAQRVEARKALNRIKRKAGLPEDFRPLHGIRHAFASMLVSSGQVDLHTLQTLLTHRNYETTLRYAHLRNEALRRASDLAGELISQAAVQGDQPGGVSGAVVRIANQNT